MFHQLEVAFQGVILSWSPHLLLDLASTGLPDVVDCSQLVVGFHLVDAYCSRVPKLCAKELVQSSLIFGDVPNSQVRLVKLTRRHANVWTEAALQLSKYIY